MTAEQQLERSVLESKEREELHAIAQAMDIKTTTRSKKAESDRPDPARPPGSPTARTATTPTTGRPPDVADVKTEAKPAVRHDAGAAASALEEIEAELDASVATNGASDQWRR